MERSMMWKTIVIIIAVLVAGVLLLAATRPATYQIERSITIQAKPETVFTLIDDLHIWPRWSPQDLLHPKMKRTFEGRDTGLGAESDWNGPRSAGKGHMVITESNDPKLIVVRSDWEKPFALQNINRFRLVPDGAGTRLTWTLSGQNVYVMKLMGLFIDMDRKMGDHLELGLSNLKAIAESPILRKLGM
jgi:uncharacterized protein YndB with AHSA1/START domain